jgi:hypothetical protein
MSPILPFAEPIRTARPRTVSSDLEDLSSKAKALSLRIRFLVFLLDVQMGRTP